MTDTTPAALAAELLPCPFCGTQPRIDTMRDESLWSHDQVLKTKVHCDGCDVSTDYTEEGQDPEAIEKWNTRAALASQAREAAEVPAGGWINAADQMPPPGKPVLVVYTTHHTPPRERINRAHWIPAKFEEAGSESDNFEYDEDTDTDYTPAGWYECIDHWDEYSAVAMAGVTVTRWMPLPSLSSVPPAPAGVVRVPLTESEIAETVRPMYADETAASMGLADDIRTARAIERAHGITPIPAGSKGEKENHNET